MLFEGIVDSNHLCKYNIGENRRKFQKYYNR